METYAGVNEKKKHMETGWNSRLITIIKAIIVTWERLFVYPHIRKYTNLTLALVIWTQVVRKYLIWEVPLQKRVRKTVTGSINWGKTDRDSSCRCFTFISQYLTTTEITLKCSTAVVFWVNKDGLWWQFGRLEKTRYRWWWFVCGLLPVTDQVW